MMFELIAALIMGLAGLIAGSMLLVAIAELAWKLVRGKL